ncbi:MAG: hypothetical protein MUP21_13380 [Dehalococcoidia bacterium]|nr:hypothetical protein [Dehalococcoidia bacterium]
MRNMSRKAAATLPSILIVLLLVLINTAAGCSSSTPSDEAIAEAIYSHLTRSAAGMGDSPCRNPGAVEVIEVEKASEKNKMTEWTVTVGVMCSGKEEQVKYVIFKDIFGDIKILKRSG